MTNPSTPTLPPDIEREISELVTKMLHGDENHQQWLKDELTPLLREFYTRAVKDTEERVWREAIECARRCDHNTAVTLEFEGKSRGYIK